MWIAVEGCCHGELDAIYATIAAAEKRRNMKVQLLLICGDFQAMRCPEDLDSMACPDKYKQMGTFSQYFLGTKSPHCLTVFIGGNHESSSYMHELPYGGWVAPNIFYLGYSGCINVGGLRIAGWSGIFDRRDFHRGHHEQPPYQRNTLHSCYHVREYDFAKLMLLSGRVDIMLSHDWPQGVCHHGNLQQLLRHKPFLKQDIDSGELGNPHAMQLMRVMRPRFWFSAHMHCKFPAHVQHAPSADPAATAATQFLALDKVLPGRDFLQFLEFTNGSFCDPDAAPAPPPPVSPPAPAPYAAEPTADKGKEEGAALVQEAALSITWDPQWLHITRLFHPLFPSTPHTMLPPHPAAVAAVASAAAAFDLVPPVFELPMAPVIDPAANLQTAALLKQLQLEATFAFSQEEQQKHLVREFGCSAPASPAPAAAAAALPHGSGRVAAFLACSHVSADPFVPVVHVQQPAPAGAGSGGHQVSANPDEIALE